MATVEPTPALDMPGGPWQATGPVPADAPAASWQLNVQIRHGDDGYRLVARVRMTDAKGNPVCARLRPPYLTWSAEPGRPAS